MTSVLEDRAAVCACGCDEPAPLAKRTNARLGHQAGEPLRFVSGHNARLRLSLESIMARVRPFDCGYEDGACWIWQGPLSRKGYGRLQVNRVHRPAHRVLFEFAAGRSLPRDLSLDHLCRQRACVNPRHLEPVTSAENARRGSLAVLTDSEVDEIRDAHGTQEQIAARFGVSRQHVSDIRRGHRRARNALEPTKVELQKSAFVLLDSLIDPTGVAA